MAAQASDKGSTAYGGLALRYAAALFELADSKHQLDAVVGDLAARVGLSEPTVSHHLARLREAGLVTRAEPCSIS